MSRMSNIIQIIILNYMSNSSIWRASAIFVVIK